MRLEVNSKPLPRENLLCLSSGELISLWETIQQLITVKLNMNRGTGREALEVDRVNKAAPYRRQDLISLLELVVIEISMLQRTTQ